MHSTPDCSQQTSVIQPTELSRIPAHPKGVVKRNSFLNQNKKVKKVLADAEVPRFVDWLAALPKRTFLTMRDVRKAKNSKRALVIAADVDHGMPAVSEAPVAASTAFKPLKETVRGKQLSRFFTQSVIHDADATSGLHGIALSGPNSSRSILWSKIKRLKPFRA